MACNDSQEKPVVKREIGWIEMEKRQITSAVEIMHRRYGKPSKFTKFKIRLGFWLERVEYRLGLIK